VHHNQFDFLVNKVQKFTTFFEFSVPDVEDIIFQARTFQKKAR
jgi:hypothetical protein